MTTKQIKAGLYVVLAVATCTFGYLTFTQYNRLMDDSLDPDKSAPPSDVPALEQKTDSRASSGYARVMTYAGLFFASVVGFAVLFGHDISHFAGNRFFKAAYDEDLKLTADPDYEAAEQVWADGHHLEAIRLMREYLQRNPREQHVALRIAEIYEKDLQNHLAAALEYEEILKKKLAPERWGWAAIHLCNLYFKLNQTEKAVELLRRIETDYSETAAAEKARKRLALYDSGDTETSAIT